MRTWTASTTVEAGPEAVLDVLTDTDAVARWAPVPFEVSGLRGTRLATGTRAYVSGRLAGLEMGFRVDVHEAAERRLVLTADGPVVFDVRYDLEPNPRGSEVHASISVRPGPGLAGRVAASATGALLSAGALDAAVSTIARQAVS